jgi:hypothetical protein
MRWNKCHSVSHENVLTVICSIHILCHKFEYTQYYKSGQIFSSLTRDIYIPKFASFQDGGILMFPLFGWAYQHGLSVGNSVFLSQQISHSRLISQKNSVPNRAVNVFSYYSMENIFSMLTTFDVWMVLFDRAKGLFRSRMDYYNQDYA